MITRLFFQPCLATGLLAARFMPVCRVRGAADSLGGTYQPEPERVAVILCGANTGPATLG